MAPLLLLLSSVLLLCDLQSLRAVEYTVTNNEPNSIGGLRFTNEIGVVFTTMTLQSASTFIWQIFGEDTETDRRDYQLVSAFVESTDSVVPGAAAYTVGSQVHINTEYIGNYYGDVRNEILGILYHETTHVWQWKGTDSEPIPVGLMEGIADYVRLKANLGPSHWVQPGEGDRWDQGYDVTARFLDYCNGLGDGFVAEINGRMRYGYSDGLWVELLGKSVDQLWDDYKAQYGN